MKRRDFLKRVGISAGVVAALPVVMTATEQLAAPASVGKMVQDGDGRVYRYQKMHRSVRKGELVFADEDLAGMPIQNAKRGEFCWLQIAGPVTADVKQ